MDLSVASQSINGFVVGRPRTENEVEVRVQSAPDSGPDAVLVLAPKFIVPGDLARCRELGVALAPGLALAVF